MLKNKGIVGSTFVPFKGPWPHRLIAPMAHGSLWTRWRTAAVLALALLLFTSSTQASNPVAVVVKILPGANLTLINNLLGGTVLDSIPDANTYPVSNTHLTLPTSDLV